MNTAKNPFPKRGHGNSPGVFPLIRTSEQQNAVAGARKELA